MIRYIFHKCPAVKGNLRLRGRYSTAYPEVNGAFAPIPKGRRFLLAPDWLWGFFFRHEDAKNYNREPRRHEERQCVNIKR